MSKLFNELYEKNATAALFAQASKTDKYILSTDSQHFKMFASSLVDIPDYPQLEKYRHILSKLDLGKISELLHEYFINQLNAISQTCVERFQLTTDKLKEIELYIIQTIGENAYNEIAHDCTDYTLFKKGLYRVHLVIGVIALAAKAKMLLSLNVLSYAVFVYTLMLKKYMKYCRADVFNIAVQNSHGNNLIGAYFKKGGHISVIEYVALSELNKFLKLKTCSPLHYTRMYTYIKSRFNQAFRNFFNSTYYKFYKQYKSELSNTNSDTKTAFTSSQISAIVQDVMNGIETLTEVPDEFITAVANSLHIDIDYAKKFTTVLLELLHKDKTVKEHIRDYFIILFKSIPPTTPEEICTNAYFRKLYQLVFSKTEAGMLMKAHLRFLIDKTLKEMKSDKSDTFKRLLIQYMFFLTFLEFVKPLYCH